MNEGQQSVYFDSTYTLRVVEEDKFKDTERLHEECTAFTQSESSINSTRTLVRMVAACEQCGGFSCAGARAAD
jgi:hypothetical protein